MSLGTILIGIAILLMLVAYITQPFHEIGTRQEDTIEVWVKQMREEGQNTTHPTPSSDIKVTCPNCGEPIQKGHHFCPQCGAPLSEGPIP